MISSSLAAPFVLAARAASKLHELFPNAPAWLSTKVLLCGIGAVALFVIALLLRGLQKFLILCAALLLALGAWW